MVKVQRGQGEKKDGKKAANIVEHLFLSEGEEEDGEVGNGIATEDEMSPIQPKSLNNWTKRDTMVLLNLIKKGGNGKVFC